MGLSVSGFESCLYSVEHTLYSSALAPALKYILALFSTIFLMSSIAPSVVY